MHNLVMQVFWLDKDAAGEDTAGAVGICGEGVTEGCGKRETARADGKKYFQPAWVEYKYVKGVYLGGSYEG
ncbi:MAG: hypothetical protein K8R06_06575 [Methanosarcinales archaeon]|nr:hypothetical protein [Methanosarcinales archaeon]MCD4816048.1 hypothetical protein [Methanosarcinales archaeon]